MEEAAVGSHTTQVMPLAGLRYAVPHPLLTGLHHLFLEGDLGVPAVMKVCRLVHAYSLESSLYSTWVRLWMRYLVGPMRA